MVEIVGILNITPDSFSDGGLFNTKDKAIFKIKQLIEDGASVIDIGAESTRPFAKSITQREEWARLEPLLSETVRLSHSLGAKVSIDTRYAHTARNAINLGVDIINDSSGLSDIKMLDLLKESQVKIILNHK